MDIIEIGTIVLLKFPYTDGTGFKRRPALALYDSEDGDIVVCRITSRIYQSPHDIYLDEWAKYGLRLPSIVRVHKMATLEKYLIETIMGKIDATVLNTVRKAYISIINETEPKTEKPVKEK